MVERFLFVPDWMQMNAGTSECLTHSLILYGAETHLSDQTLEHFNLAKFHTSDTVLLEKQMALFSIGSPSISGQMRDPF